MHLIAGSALVTLFFCCFILHCRSVVLCAGELARTYRFFLCCVAVQCACICFYKYDAASYVEMYTIRMCVCVCSTIAHLALMNKAAASKWENDICQTNTHAAEANTMRARMHKINVFGVSRSDT